LAVEGWMLGEKFEVWRLMIRKLSQVIQLKHPTDHPTTNFQL